MPDFHDLFQPLPSCKKVIIRHFLDRFLITQGSVRLLVQVAFLNLDSVKVLNTANLRPLSDIRVRCPYFLWDFYCLSHILPVSTALVPLKAESGV